MEAATLQKPLGRLSPYKDGGNKEEDSVMAERQ
jgi:hypothetical protein